MKNCLIVSANDRYIPYLSVLLASVIETDGMEEGLEVVILYEDISEQHRNQIVGQVKETFVTIRFVNVHERIKNYSFFTNGTGNQTYLTKEAYFRLLAPWILTEYHKALYLDCDMVVRAGWQNIYEMNLENFLLAAVQDIWGNWECYDTKSMLYQYRVKELELDNPVEYFNSGMMLLNLEAFRNTFHEGELVELAASRGWAKHDQDVLNYIGNGKIKWLDFSWNMIECPGERAKKAIPEKILQMYETQKKQPYIIHYASRKPWIIKGVNFEQEFWRAAADSSFFDELLTGFIEEQLSQGTQFEKQALNSIRQGKIGVKFIMKCVITWIKEGKKPKRKSRI